jgi:hypothetical protein
MGILAFVAHLDAGQILPSVILYIGPDVFLPFTSALAAVAGLVLMFWQRFVALFRRLWRTLLQPKE